MDTQNLRTFLTLASVKNFTQTANLMFIAQSTVTNRRAGTGAGKAALYP